MPLTDRAQIVRLAKCYETLPSNVQRSYAIKNVPKKCDPTWLRALEAETCDPTRLCALNADKWLCKHLVDAAKRGCLTRAELKKIARWKYPGGQTLALIMENRECEVLEISKASFVARSERLRIGALLALHGVGWPMASTILHFVFPKADGYPVLDKKTMAAVGGSTNYNFKRWMEYIKLCRDTAQKLNVTLRELDRALWILGNRKGIPKAPA